MPFDPRGTPPEQPARRAGPLDARTFRCGTLVILHALRRHRLRDFVDFDADYEAEVDRLVELATGTTSGGQFELSQPYRIGERFSRAIVSDALSGRTPLSDALRLTSLRSLSNFDNYAADLGVA